MTALAESPINQRTIQPTDETHCHLFGVGELVAMRSLAAEGFIESEPVRTLALGDLGAIWAPVPASWYAAAGLDARMSDVQWIGPKVIAHDRVLAAARAVGTVVPVRFGGIFTSEAALLRRLSRHADVLRRAIDALRDADEWDVRVLVDRELAAAAYAGNRAKELGALTPGAAYLSKLKAKRDSGGEVIERARATAELILRDLRSATRDMKPLKSLKASEGELAASHSAALIRRCDADLVNSRVSEINLRHAREGLRVEIVGPWTPYSFCPELTDDAE
jgi:hypothetical protein